MREIKLKKGTTIKLYDNIDEVPIVNYWKAKEFWRIDSEFPRDPADIMGKYIKLDQYIQKEMNDEARKELQIIIQSHVAQTGGIDHESLSFSIMIHSINNKQIDYTEDHEELKKRMMKLSNDGLTFSMVHKEITELKKKLMLSLQ